MKTWIFNRREGEPPALTPADPVNPIRHGRQTGEGRNSDDVAQDQFPTLSDADLHALESGEMQRGFPRDLMASAPPRVHRDTPRPSISDDSSENRKSGERRVKSEEKQSGLSHLAHAAAGALERFMLGDEDEDIKPSKLLKGDRYAGVRERQEMFMNDINAQVRASAAPSPFERYRTRMGERTGSSELAAKALESQNADKLANQPAATPQLNRIASDPPNRRIEPQSTRRLLVSDKPLTLSPQESRPSVDNPARANSNQSVSEVPRGSFEVASASVLGSQLGSQGTGAPIGANAPAQPPYQRIGRIGQRPTIAGSGDAHAGVGEGITIRSSSLEARNTSPRSPLRSIEEGRDVHTRVQNTRVIQPRYVLTRALTYTFGTASILGLVIGCAVLGIAIRNAHYLQGPHAAQEIPSIHALLNQTASLVGQLAVAHGIDPQAYNLIPPPLGP